MRPIAISLFATSLLVAAGAPDKLPYSQNVVEHVTFDPQGTWTITGIAGTTQAHSFSRVRRHHLFGSEISIRGSRVEFSSTKFMPSRQAFSIPVISQQTYDTRSKEFWLDFAINPKLLSLPLYVSAVDLEVATLLATQDGRAFLDFEGAWFTLERVGVSSRSAP